MRQRGSKDGTQDRTQRLPRRNTKDPGGSFKMSSGRHQRPPTSEEKFSITSSSTWKVAILIEEICNTMMRDGLEVLEGGGRIHSGLSRVVK